MPQFEYFALDVNGKQRKGKLVADTQEQAAAELKKQGLFPTQLIDPEAKKRLQRRRAKRNGGIGSISIGAPVIKRKDLTVFTRQLATLLEAGLPLIRSLRTLERQAKNPAIKRIVGETADIVEGGSTFAEALSHNPRSFDRLYLNMVRAGEASGAMEAILGRLASFMEKAARIAHKVKSAMIYPAVVLTIALTVCAGLMIFIVPNFEKMFTEMLEGESLPSVTLFVIGISRDSVESHRKFAEKYDLPFILLSDPELQAIRAYGVWQEKKLYGKSSMGVVRTTFIIDESGAIAEVMPKVKPDTNAADVLALLK